MARRTSHLCCQVLLSGLALFAALNAGCSRESAGGTSPSMLRLGYQKWSTFNILKYRKTLEGRLRTDGVSVQWIEFPSGPPLLEALNAGSIDIGHAGDSPPIFAQAAGIPFVYVGASAESPASSAILVRTDSPIQSVAELRGRRVGYTKGSSAYTLVLRAVAQAGLAMRDIESVFLSPADARAALAGGSIDAWAIWDPYFAAAEQAGEVRVLVDAKGLAAAREFYLASTTLDRDHPQLVDAVLEELQALKEWAPGHADEIAEHLAPDTGLDAAVILRAEARRQRYGLVSLSGPVLADQQATADAFFECGLIPERIAVADAVRERRFARR
jgi:sulfonate transport system substrate-binding protein